MNDLDYENSLSEELYEKEATKLAILALENALLQGCQTFDFCFDVSPETYYKKYFLHEKTDELLIPFKLFFFYDDKPVYVRYDINKYAHIDLDFSIEYIPKPEFAVLDLAYISQNSNAMDFYVSLLQGMYHSKQDIISIRSCLTFENPSSQIDLIKDSPEHDKQIASNFPEVNITEFIDKINKLLSSAHQLSYSEIRPQLYRYWLELEDKDTWDIYADLEPILTLDTVLIKSRLKNKIIC